MKSIFLLVSAGADLEMAQHEEGALRRSGLRVYRATTKADAMQVAESMRQNGDKFDLFWYIGHCGPDGLIVSDGVWSSSGLTAFLRSHRIGSVFLNTCSSVGFANTIVQEAGADVVATIMDIPDRTAYETGALLAQSLAEGKTLRDAYWQSRPGKNENYVYLADMHGNGNVNEQGRRSSNLSDMSPDEKLDMVIRKIVGDTWHNEPGIIAMLNKIEGQQKDAIDARRVLSDRITKHDELIRVMALVMWTTATVSAIEAVAIIWLLIHIVTGGGA